MKFILVVGPSELIGTGGYGGGSGGYTRNLKVYLRTLSLDDYKLKPYHHTVRGRDGWILGNSVIRLIRDTCGFLWVCCLRRRPDAVHILAQYRGALPRELFIALICRLLKIPLVYDVKAGAFGGSYGDGSFFYRAMQRMVIRLSKQLFAEGEKSKAIIKSEFGRDAVYFPNFVMNHEVPTKGVALFAKDRLRLLFVGYCYSDKGVVELVEGAKIAAAQGQKITLNLIGAEHPEFTDWMDAFEPLEALEVIRHGQLPHPKVMEAMQNSDVYVYPTSHVGEGHNNSINEAMMHGLVVLTTRHGFLGDVLGGDCAYFLNEVDPEEIANKFAEIGRDPEAARVTAMNARTRLTQEFTETSARARFRESYRNLFLKPGTDLAITKY